MQFVLKMMMVQFTMLLTICQTSGGRRSGKCDPVGKVRGKVSFATFFSLVVDFETANPKILNVVTVHGVTHCSILTLS